MNTPLSENRLSFIVNLIEKRGSVKVADLAKELSVSEMTIRRDLAELEKRRLVKRIHGGAVGGLGRSYEPPLLVRTTRALEAKKAIGKYAASMVDEGDCIAVDVGTTTNEMATYLRGKHNITVITPSLQIANILSKEANMQLIVPGGVIRQSEGSLIGDLAQSAFQKMFVDKLFLGVGCVSADAGLTEYTWDGTLVKQAMIKSAREVIVLADSTKFNKTAFILIAGFDKVHQLITDKMPPDDLYGKLQEAGVTVSIVDVDEKDV